MAASNSMASDALGIDDITSGLTRTILADNNTGKKAGNDQGQETKEEEQAINALGAAWSNWSLEDDEEAKAQREAQRLREQTEKEQEEKMRALKLAEEKRESDEYDALQRQFQEHGARVHEIKRKERIEEAVKQRRLAAEAETIALAEQRAQEERQMQEALAAQAKRDADDRARLELFQVYERNLAESNAIAIAQANAQAHWQQQRLEAEQLAQHHELVARQAYFAELQQRQQEEFFLQQRQAEQHQAYPQGEQVAESTEGMDTAQGDFGFEEMDTAPEMEASGVTEMDWENVGETTPLLAEPLVPSVQPPTPIASEPSTPIEEPQLPGAPFLAAEGPGRQLLRIDERPIEANTMSVTEVTAVTAATAKTVEAAPAIPEPATAAPMLRQPPLEAIPPPPRVTTPPPPPAPMPAPAQSSQKTTTILFKRAVPNHALAAFRSTISPWSALGRLLSQRKSIPKDLRPQVLGKRAREESEDAGPAKKKAKLDGEFRLDVGGKRKRETEVFSGSKRVMLGRILGRVLAIPGSRFAAGPLISLPPTLAPASSSPNAPPPSPPSPSSSPPPPPTPPPPPPLANQTPPAAPHRGLAEAIEIYNDLPTLRAEIQWMRDQRQLNISQKKTRPIDKTIKRIVTPASYWSKYREKLSR